MKVFLVHPDPVQAKGMETRLRAAGWRVVVSMLESEPTTQFWQEGPDVVVVALLPGRDDVLDFAMQVDGYGRVPLVLVGDGAGADLANELLPDAIITDDAGLGAAMVQAAPDGVVNLHGFGDPWEQRIGTLRQALLPHRWAARPSTTFGCEDVRDCLELINMTHAAPEEAARIIAGHLGSKHTRDHDFLYVHDNPVGVQRHLDRALDRAGPRYAYWHYHVAGPEELVQATLRMIGAS